MDLEVPAKKDAMEALVAASKFGKMSSRKDLLKIVAELHKDPEQTDTQAMIVHRESVLLRLGGKPSESQRVIQEFLDRPFIFTLYAQRGGIGRDASISHRECARFNSQVNVFDVIPYLRNAAETTHPLLIAL